MKLGWSQATLAALLLAATAADAADLAAAKRLYEAQCSPCHGVDGRATGSYAPSFARGERLEKADAELIAAIREGVGDRMPPWGAFLTATEMADLVAYARTLAGAAPARSGGATN